MKVAQLLDASALLAVAFEEDGAEQVMLALSRPQVGITVANLSEVVSKLRQRGMSLAGCRAFIDDLQLIVVSADTETALLVGELHAQTRWAGLLRRCDVPRDGGAVRCECGDCRSRLGAP